MCFLDYVIEVRVCWREISSDLGCQAVSDMVVN